MTRLLLVLFSLVQFADLAFGQGIRATTDRVVKPAVRQVQAVTPDTYRGRQIRVGRGGGFTGFVTTYYLLDNGKLFGRRSPDSTFTFIRQQTTTRTKRMFTTVENTCKIKKTKFDQPGNQYTFVQWQKGKQSYKVAWGLPGKVVPAAYPKFVHSFMTMIPASFKTN